jgi:hypothetical protein
MLQRALIAACLLVMLASLSLVGLVWHRSNEALRASADANRRLAERLAEAQAGNQAKMAELVTRSEATSAEMLKQLKAMAKTSESPQAPDWIPVTFKLTRETVDGPPAARCHVTLEKGSGGLFDRGMRRESDSAGLVDFGVVHPGDWEFELTMPYDEQHTWKARGNLNVLPGTKVAKTIVCPGPLPQRSTVKLRSQWPPDLAGKNLRVEATFVQKPIEFQPPLKWTAHDSLGKELTRAILYGAGTQQTAIGDATRLDLWNVYGGSSASLGAVRVFGDFHSDSSRTASDAVAIESGNFLLRRLIVLRPIVRDKTAIKGERFAVLAHIENPGVIKEPDDWSGEVRAYSTDPDSENESLGPGLPLNRYKGSVTVEPLYWRQLEGHFAVRPGQVNDWTVPLPEELLKVVREQLDSNDDQPRASATNELDER